MIDFSEQYYVLYSEKYNYYFMYGDSFSITPAGAMNFDSINSCMSCLNVLKNYISGTSINKDIIDDLIPLKIEVNYKASK